MFHPVEKSLTEPLFIHVSNFRKVKQPLVTVQIFEQVVKEFPKAKMLFVGDGPEKKVVREYVKKNKIRHVTFLKSVKSNKEVAALYQKAHVLLLPSLYESFSLAALEAQACGTPVIATNVGALPKVVLHGKTGYLARPADVDKHAKQALKLVRSEKLWKSMSVAAVRNAQQYTNDKVMHQYTQIYDALN